MTIYVQIKLNDTTLVCATASQSSQHPILMLSPAMGIVGPPPKTMDQSKAEKGILRLPSKTITPPPPKN